MKIAIIARRILELDGTEAIGGSERVTLNIANTLRGFGHDVVIYQKSSVSQSRTLNQGIEVVELRVKLQSWSRSLLRFALDDGCDAILFQDVHLIRRTPRGLPVIAINHGVFWDYPITRESRRWYPFNHLPFWSIKILVKTWRRKVRSREIRKLKKCDALLVFDTTFLRIIQSSLPELRLRIFVIPAFSDLPSHFNRNVNNASHSRSQKRLSTENPLSILVPRNASLSSGARWLVEIASELYELDNDLRWRIRVAGRGVSHSGKAIENFVHKRIDEMHAFELYEKIDFLGYLDRVEMLRAYEMADVILVPTFAYEGICLSVIEAMSLGKPIVATNIGGLNDSVVDGVNGLLANPTPPQIAEALHTVLVDEGLRSKLSQGSYLLSSRFTKERFDAALHTVFDKVTPME